MTILSVAPDARDTMGARQGRQRRTHSPQTKADRFAPLRPAVRFRLQQLHQGIGIQRLRLQRGPAAHQREIGRRRRAQGVEPVGRGPGPRPRLDPALLPTLRRAILEVRLIVIRYAGSGADEPATRVLCPYGTLYGGNGRAWLVGHVEGLPEMRLWRLDRIVSIDLLDRCFARREEFDLASYAAQSFGVFQEEPIDVVLRFSPEAADDAASWAFHPSQTQEREHDGGLLVRFRAGGMQEMCWQMFTWGAELTIAAPYELRNRLIGLLEDSVQHHQLRRSRQSSD